MSALICKCGCKQPAEWLVTGWSPEGGFKDEPACDSSACYLSECCAELDVPFSQKRIPASA